MNYRRAYDFMNEMYEFDFTDDQTDVVAQAKIELELLCMKAIDKQIPRKVTNNGYFYGYTYHCPICESQVEKRAYGICDKYCHTCGQALDWSD